MKAVRNFLHYFISLLMWILFGYYWYVVSGRKISWGTFQALTVLGLVSLLGLAVTTLWIRHNQRLARRNRRSQAPPPAPAGTGSERRFQDKWSPPPGNL